MDDELRNKIESRIEEMNQAWADKQVPEAIPEEKWECDAKWCPYYTLCKLMPQGRCDEKQIKVAGDDFIKINKEMEKEWK